MRKLLNITLLIAALALVGVVLSRYFRSDEAIIKNQLLDVAEAFNDRLARSCVEILADDFRDTTTGYGKQDIRERLFYLFTKTRNIKGKFPYRVVIRENLVEVELDRPDRVTGTIRFNCQLMRVEDNRESIEWEFEVTAGGKKADNTWLFTTAEHKTSGGTRPF